MIILTALFASLIGTCLGIAIGRGRCEYSLTLNPDRRGVTGAHCLRGKFYYIVPESLWTKKLCTCVRDELASEVPKIGSD